MKVRNKHSMPALLYGPCARVRPIIEGEVHVTTLIGPALIYYLMKEHWDDIEEDASDRLWALMGTAMHAVISGDGQLKHTIRVLDSVVKDYESLDSRFVEDFLKNLLQFLQKGGDGIETALEYQYNADWKIVGQDDHYNEDERILMDWKTTSVWSYLSLDKNWDKQLNVYAQLRRWMGYPVEKLEVWALLRDWKWGEMIKDGHNGKYPKIPFVQVPIRLWSEKEAKEYIAGRIKIFSSPPVECTPEEKWQKPTRFKVRRQNQKSALIASIKVDGERQELLTMGDALTAARKHKRKSKGVWIDDPITIDGTKIYIEKIEGESTRCARYCSPSKFCPYYSGDKDE